jgi:hypothetical protein
MNPPVGGGMRNLKNEKIIFAFHHIKNPKS